MDDTEINTIQQVKRILKAGKDWKLKAKDTKEKYTWIDGIIKRFNYHRLSRKDKGILRRYMMMSTGYSRSQLSRLISRQLLSGKIESFAGRRNKFSNIYTRSDIELLAQIDNLHNRLSGPATKTLLERAYRLFGDKRFERLSRISSAHIYNLRKERVYRDRAITMGRTKTVQVAIGTRRKPKPDGKPGYLRVDSVHQGDYKGQKGVYHINLVDEVTQWEIVVCVSAINECLIREALDKAIELFPFVIINFHSDNGSEFINGMVADLLNKALISQSKSRAGRTNDNALVEGKNGSIIRKHIGYWHIERKYASYVQEFYLNYFNEYLNYHRPCAFATITVDEKGRRNRRYKTYMTPYDRLKSLPNAQSYLKQGFTFEQLDKIAMSKTDSQSAQIMQQEKDKLFRKILKEAV